MPKSEDIIEKELKAKKEFMKIQNKYDLEKHERWMEGLKFQRDTEAISHDHALQRQRIKTAEIRKTYEMKQGWQRNNG